MVARTRENIQIVGKKNLYEKFFKVDEYRLKFPLYNGEMSGEISREVMERGRAAGVLLYDPDLDKLVFVEQMRVGVFAAGDENPWVLECVAGILDHENESPADVVAREAAEEAGVAVTAVEPVCEYYSSPGGLSEKLYVYCGRADASRVPEHAGLESEGEDIRVVVLSAAEVEEMLSRGKFNNALTIIAVQWFVMNREKLRKKWGKS